MLSIFEIGSTLESVFVFKRVLLFSFFLFEIIEFFVVKIIKIADAFKEFCRYDCALHNSSRAHPRLHIPRLHVRHTFSRTERGLSQIQSQESRRITHTVINIFRDC